MANKSTAELMPICDSDRDGCVGRIAQARLDAIHIDRLRIQLAHEDEIIALAVDGVGEHHAVRESFQNVATSLFTAASLLS